MSYVSYDWKAALVFFATLVVLTVGGRFLAFRVPAFQRMRELNREADLVKLSRDRIRRTVEASNRSALATNALFYVAVLPFFLSLDPRPLWRHVVDILAVLLVFDLFYYLTHRFLFHGNGPLVKVHALHHQAHTPTYIDGLFVHLLETFLGLVLFLGSIPLVAVVTGAPLNAFSMAVATLIFTQVNTINHCYVNLRYFPFNTLSKITALHATHHVDMNRGNYAVMSMVYDRIFGTLEAPAWRDKA